MAWETWVQSLVESYQRPKERILDASLLNTQHYQVGIKGKLDQSKEGKNRFMDLPGTLAYSEKQTASSRFWTRITDSIFVVYLF